MHILLVADGRSPITSRWIQGMLALEHQVTLVSTYPCEAMPGVLAQHCLPVAFAGLAGGQAGRGESSRGTGSQPGRRWSPKMDQPGSPGFPGRTLLAGSAHPAALRQELRQILAQAKPDLVHALRIPFEGMLAAAAEPDVPLVVRYGAMT